MTWYFAYASNMSRALMQGRCPGAAPVGPADLPGWRFRITADGFASIAPRPGATVRGVLWRLGARELAALNAYEAIESGLYVRRRLPVRRAGRLLPALVYISPRRGEGVPRPAYIALVAEAAREWRLPETYVRSLERWSTSRWRGARPKDTGDFG
jgi:cation transport regulator ChaC